MSEHDDSIVPQLTQSDKGSSPSQSISRLASTASEKFLAASGVCLVMASVCSFVAIIYIEFRSGGLLYKEGERWIDIVSAQSSTVVLLVIGIVCALLGIRLLTTTQNALARTIPKEDLPMIQEAVIAGKSEPIDQYVRLRSLAGWAGAFTKLGITGLPLVTVVLTLIFSLIALFPVAKATDFLDLAKLTLGAFIGSFVQRNVELRRQEVGSANAGIPSVKPNLPV
jgi:hypothetical protein